MEEVADKIISELEALRQEANFMESMLITTETKLDDPGLVLVDEYPYMYVAPISEVPVKANSTIGLAGYDVEHLFLQVGVVVNASDFFDASVDELPATRELVQVARHIKRHFKRFAKRRLDSLAGVRDLEVQQTTYVPDLRDNVFVRVALITIAVEKQYQHEE